MGKSIFRDLLFALLVVAFSCLLLSGGSRLIATPEQETIPIQACVSWLHASLTCPPPPQAQSLSAPAQNESKADAVMLGRCESGEQKLFVPQTDANGNILRQASYMHAVYQAFALGDGFV